MDALDLSVLLGGSDRDQLVVDRVLAQDGLERMGHLNMGHEDAGELCSMIGLDLLDGEGKSS